MNRSLAFLVMAVAAACDAPEVGDDHAALLKEGFEIVSRRLFEPLRDPDQFRARDVVGRACEELYRSPDQE